MRSVRVESRSVFVFSSQHGSHAVEAPVEPAQDLLDVRKIAACAECEGFQLGDPTLDRARGNSLACGVPRRTSVSPGTAELATMAGTAAEITPIMWSCPAVRAW